MSRVLAKRQSLFDTGPFSFLDYGEYFQAHYTPTIHPETASALKISKYQTNRKILDASSLTDAVRGCDTYASGKVLKGQLSLALSPSSLLQHPCSNSTPVWPAPRGGAKRRPLLLKYYLWQRGGDTSTSLCKISGTLQTKIRSRRD